MARFVLSQKQSFDLMKHVEGFYSASGLGDKEFAAAAANAIPLAGLNEHHVFSARKSLGLQSNVRTGRAIATVQNEIIDRLAAIEQLVAGQEKQIEAIHRSLHQMRPQGVR